MSVKSVMNSTTGYSAFRLLTGREMVGQGNLIFDVRNIKFYQEHHLVSEIYVEREEVRNQMGDELREASDDAESEQSIGELNETSSGVAGDESMGRGDAETGSSGCADPPEHVDEGIHGLSEDLGFQYLAWFVMSSLVNHRGRINFGVLLGTQNVLALH